MGRYSEKFRARMVGRLVGADAVSATSLAKEVGVAQATLSKWLRSASGVGIVPKRDNTPQQVNAEAGTPAVPRKRPQDWSPDEKLQALLDAAALQPDELGPFLRARGLHEAHLAEWRAAFLEALAAARKGTRKPSAEAKRIKELERELLRKDKALAETAALLVLKKKLQHLWSAGDDDTGEENEW